MKSSKNKKKFLNKITIVIFSYNMHGSLKKKILLYKNKYRLIILDRTENSLEGFCNINLDKKSLYFHLPGKSYIERFFLLKNFLKTKYVMVQTDDDFFFEGNIAKSIFFLEKNKSYSCVAGRAYKFSILRNNIYLKNIFKKIYTLSDDNNILRVKAIFEGDFNNIRYGVVRSLYLLKYTEILKKNYKIYKDEMYRLMDVQAFLVFAILGKIKILNKIFYLRYFRNLRRNWPNSSTYMAIDMYIKFTKGNYNRFLKTVLTSLNLNHHKNPSIINEILKKYLFNYSCRKKKEFSLKNLDIFLLLKKLVPSILSNFLKFKLGLNGEMLSKSWLSTSGMKYNKKEYAQIINCKQYFEKSS
jgi:hypothetical protein